LDLVVGLLSYSNVQLSFHGSGPSSSHLQLVWSISHQKYFSVPLGDPADGPDHLGEA